MIILMLLFLTALFSKYFPYTLKCKVGVSKSLRFEKCFRKSSAAFHRLIHSAYENNRKCYSSYLDHYLKCKVGASLFGLKNVFEKALEDGRHDCRNKAAFSNFSG